MPGKNTWYIVDGYRPNPQSAIPNDYVGHECYMILNVNDEDAHLLIDVYFADRDPVENIPLTVRAKRIRAFRSSESDLLGVDLGVNQQYSIRIRSDVGVVVQYGRLDVTQPNMAFLATMGYSE